MVAASAGTEMAHAPGDRPGRALRVLTAESQAEALREEMKTLEAPAWRRLLVQGVSLVYVKKKKKLRGLWRCM